MFPFGKQWTAMDIATRLILFADVIDNGSFSKAAERHAVNRSYVSKQIAKLEEHLGVRLLHRSTRSLSPTDAGHAVYQHACILRDQLNETDALVSSLREDVSGQLRISSTTFFGRLHVMPVVEQLLEEFPGLSIDLRLEDRYVDIVGERFDVAIRITEPDNSSLIARKLADNPFYLVASPEYLKQQGAPQSVDDLKQHRMVVYGSDINVTRGWSYRDGSEIRTFPLQPRLTVNDGEALLQAAQDGVGIALIALFGGYQELKQGSIVRVLPQLELMPFAPLYIMYPSREHMAKKTRLFIDRMFEYVGRTPFWLGNSRVRL
ncbi:MAG: LysR family transcriptional regulator [Chromatiales bacterium]|jgi:DNA-binding transcriptional LysR family regulator